MASKADPLFHASYPEWRKAIRELLWEQAGRKGTLPPGLPEALPVQRVAAAVKQFMTHQWQVTPQTALEFLDMTFPEGSREEILFGILLLTLFKRKLPPKTWPMLETWVRHIADVDVCDQLAINLSGRLIAGDKARFKVIHEWSGGPAVLVRRFAILSAVAALKKEACRPRDVIRLLDGFMSADTAPLQNAVVWALGQLTRIDEPEVVELLKKWQGRANPEIFKRAGKHLSGTARFELVRAKRHG